MFETVALRRSERLLVVLLEGGEEGGLAAELAARGAAVLWVLPNEPARLAVHSSWATFWRARGLPPALEHPALFAGLRGRRLNLDYAGGGGYAEAGQTRLCWGAAEEAAPHGDASQMQKRRRPAAGGGGGGKRGRW